MYYLKSIVTFYNFFNTTAGRVKMSITLDEDGYEQPTSYLYDLAGRQTAVIDPLGHSITCNEDDPEYSGPRPGAIAAVTYTGTHRTETHYDGPRRDTVTDAAGHVTSFICDDLGRVITTVHPATDIDGIDQDNDDNFEDDITYTHVAYDSLGRKQYETAAVSFPVMPAEDTADFNNSVKEYVYDVSGRLTRVVLPQVQDPADAQWKFPYYDYLYDDDGNMTGIIDPEDRLTAFKYDHLHRQTHKYMPFAISSAEHTNLLDGTADVYTLLAAASPLYEQSVHDDTAFSHLAYHMDYKQQVTAYTYDSRGRLEYKLYYQADGDLDGDNENYAAGTCAEYEHYTYDPLGRQHTVTDSRGTTTYVYDDEGRVESVIAPEGTVNYEYSPITGQKTRTYSSNTDMDYFYDDLGRLAEVSTAAESTYYGYDEAGNRTWQCIDTTGDFAYDPENPSGYEIKTGYTYDALNRLTDLVQQRVTGTPTQIASYHYTLAANGMRSGLEESILQSAGTESRSIDYTYDNLNRLTAETADSSGDGYDTEYTYDLAGNRLKRVIVSGGQTLTTEYDYYPGTDRLKTERHCGPSCAMTVGNETYYAYNSSGEGFYYHDSSGNRIGSVQAFLMGLPSIWNSVLFYSLMILIPIAFFGPVFVRQWTRIRGSIDPLASPDLHLWHRMLCVLLAYIFLIGPEVFHHLAQADVQYGNLSTDSWGSEGDVFSYCYDENGSMTYKFYGEVDVENDTPQELISSTSTAYDRHIYNLQNRLARIEKYDASHSLIEAVEYQYDTSGIRVAKIDDPDGTPIVTTYLIDPYNPTGYAQVLEEWRVDGNDAVLTTYTLGDDVISQTRSDWEYATQWTQAGAAATLYMLYDGHGSTRQLACWTGTGSDITVSTSYSYDGYGVLLQNDSAVSSSPGHTSQQETNLLYAGEQFDTAAQMYYNRARYYSPLNGLFNRIDPYSGNMHDPQSLHKYTYVHNNPVNGIDPSGLILIRQSIRRLLKHFGTNHGLRLLIGIAATYVLGLEYIRETGANPDSVTINRQVARLKDLKTKEQVLKWVAEFALRPDIVDHDKMTVYEIKPDDPGQIRLGKLQINGYIAALNIFYGKMYVPGSWRPKAGSYLIASLPGVIGLPSIYVRVRNAGWGIIAYEIEYQDLERTKRLLQIGLGASLTLAVVKALPAMAKMYPGLVTVKQLSSRTVAI